MRRGLLAVSIVVACTVGLAACVGAGEEPTPTDRSGANPDAVPGDETDWRVLADEHGIGGDPVVYVATSEAEYDTVWSRLGFRTDRPSVDLDEEVVVVFTVSYPSGCEFPFISLDVDHTNGTISPRYAGNEPAVCAADENPYTVILAIRRDGLIADSYDVRLTAVHPDVADATAAELQPSD